METIFNESMELNRETAMRLWNKTFGKDSKATDFAGRIIAKGAYNDRNSEYGWNVDHILPQSKGGVTADHNLICCHIKTNDEKADRFPCFSTNGTTFEIIRVQNHYEIQPKAAKVKEKDEPRQVNFYDSAAGVRLFKELKGIQNKKRFVGTVFIYLEDCNNGAVVEFIEKIFDQENISYGDPGHYPPPPRPFSQNDIVIKITDYDMPDKADTSHLLDKCILLNTYLSNYFVETDYLKRYDIYFRVDFDDRSKIFHPALTRIPASTRNPFSSFSNNLYINDLVIENTEAKSKGVTTDNFGYAKYNYYFTKLKKDLQKEVNG